MRNGKIAKLSHPVRDELNLRMENSEDGAKLLEWLNAVPQVQMALKASFAGVAISKQNLSEWRRGGFREWQMQQDLISHACQLSECGREMGEVVDPPLLAGDLVAVLAARYAALLNTWDGEAEPKFEEKLRLLRGLAHDIALIQRTIQRATTQKNEFEQQLEDSHQRVLDEVKKKTLAPIWAMLQSKSLAGAFGGGAAGKKMAEFMAAVEHDLPLPTDFQEVQPGQTQSNPVKLQTEV
jgi:uncharacterized protein YukE